MLRTVCFSLFVMALSPMISFGFQVESEGSWGGDVSSSTVSSLGSYGNACNSPNCSNGSGGCGQTGCSDPPCNGPLYQQKYISIFGGYSDVDNFERTITDSATRYVDGLNVRDGYGTGLAIGGQMIEYVRSEFEVTYRQNDFSSFLQQEFDLSTGLLETSDRFDASGRLQSYSGMFNLLFDTCPRCPGSPSLYLGGGLGGLYADGEAVTGADTFTVQDSAFAYQFIAGINYPIRKQLDLYTEYRYLGADKLNVENATLDESMGDFGFDSHNVFFGLRFWK